MGKGLERPPRGRVITLRSAHALAHELGPRGLEELAERHTRGTGALATAAAQAQIEVARDGRREPDPAFRGRPHEVDAATRRVHLLSEHPIGRALGQADAAVYARPEPVHGRR